MDKKVKDLIRSIDDLREKLKSKETELKKIQKKCHHVWPEKWSEKVGRDYGVMSAAVDPVLRTNSPEIIAVPYKICEICGKEKTKETSM